MLCKLPCPEARSYFIYRSDLQTSVGRRATIWQQGIEVGYRELTIMHTTFIILLVSMCPWALNFTRASQFFFPS